jgi:polyhydroxyalkanoate synthesis repressor PhaR
MIVKRYSNRKLYDTEARCYISLSEVAEMIRRGQDVRVVDHASGRDLTSLTLFQILLSEEKRIGELLPQVVLTRLIQAGGDSFEALRERLLAAFDPRGHAEEEMRRRLDDLVARGEMDAAIARQLLTQLLGAAVPPPVVDEEAVPDLEDLQRQLQALEEELARLR